MEISQSTDYPSNPPAQLGRNFSFISMLGLAFAILNSWTAFASSLPLSLTSGGPTSIIWGLLVAGSCTLCIALSLAEFLSAYPNSAGQYHWVSVSWSKYAAVLSWFTAWFNVAGWVCLTTTASLFGSSLVMNIASFHHPGYEMQRWHTFLVYSCFCLVAFLANVFLNRLLSTINKIALTWSLCGFVVISITALSCVSPNYNPPSFVFQEFISETGWPDGLAWLLGLLQGGLCLTGFDAIAHMIEEIPSPTIQGPRVMISCVAIGIFTSLAFIIALLFVSGDISLVITSTYGPLLQILSTATRNKAAATCLLLFPIGCLLLGVAAIMTTCSRVIRALGRDSGLPFSHVWAKIHPSLGTPLNALALNALLTICCGCIYLGSSSAFNALSSATVVCFDISYGIPILVHCLRGRNQLPERPWALPPFFGWFVNLLAIGYILLTTVLFLFPPTLPVTGSNMNYAAAAVGVVVSLSTLCWFLQGRDKFNRRTVVAGVESTPTADISSPVKV